MTSIFISELLFFTSQEDLTNHFNQFGEIIGVRVFSRKIAGIKKGFAKIKYKTREAVLKALEQTTHFFQEREISVEWLQTQKQLESNLSKISNFVYVSNVPPTISKQKLQLFLSEKAGIRKIYRIIKKKSKKKNSAKKKSAIIQLEESDQRREAEFNALNLELDGFQLIFSKYDTGQGTGSSTDKKTSKPELSSLGVKISSKNIQHYPILDNGRDRKEGFSGCQIPFPKRRLNQHVLHLNSQNQEINKSNNYKLLVKNQWKKRQTKPTSASYFNQSKKMGYNHSRDNIVLNHSQPTDIQLRSTINSSYNIPRKEQL